MAGERPHRPQLTGQPAAGLALDPRLAEDLDGDGTAELGLPGAIDGAEAAPADLDGVLAPRDPEVDPDGGRSLLLATPTRPLHGSTIVQARGAVYNLGTVEPSTCATRVARPLAEARAPAFSAPAPSPGDPGQPYPCRMT